MFVINGASNLLYTHVFGLGAYTVCTAIADTMYATATSCYMLHNRFIWLFSLCVEPNSIFLYKAPRSCSNLVLVLDILYLPMINGWGTERVKKLFIVIGGWNCEEWKIIDSEWVYYFVIVNAYHNIHTLPI